MAGLVVPLDSRPVPKSELWFDVSLTPSLVRRYSPHSRIGVSSKHPERDLNYA